MVNYKLFIIKESINCVCLNLRENKIIIIIFFKNKIIQ